MGNDNYVYLNNSEISDRSWLVTLLLAIFFPIHRFYVGRIWSGIFFWLTGGLSGLWYAFDIVWILLDKFTDKYGRKLKK